MLKIVFVKFVREEINKKKICFNFFWFVVFFLFKFMIFKVKWVVVFVFLEFFGEEIIYYKYYVLKIIEKYYLSFVFKGNNILK